MNEYIYKEPNNRARIVGKIVSSPKLFVTSQSGIKYYLFFINCVHNNRNNLVPISAFEWQLPQIEQLASQDLLVVAYGKAESRTVSVSDNHFFEQYVMLQDIEPYQEYVKNTNVFALTGEVIRNPEQIQLHTGKTIRRFLIKAPLSNGCYSLFSVSAAQELIDYTLHIHRNELVACKGKLIFHPPKKTSTWCSLRGHLSLIVPQDKMTDSAWKEFNDMDNRNREMTDIFLGRS